MKPPSIPVVTEVSSMLRRLVRSSSQKVGMPPGSVVHVGRRKVDKLTLSVIDYSKSNLEEVHLKAVADSYAYIKTDTVSWIDIVGMHDVKSIAAICEHFGVHPLTQEDIVNTGQRPSFEEFPEYLFFTLKMLSVDEHDEIVAEHISLIIGKNFLISFQERKGDVFEGVRTRIRDKRKIIAKPTDYLGYALIDAIVDHYFIVLEKIGDRIEELDEELQLKPKQSTLIRINKLKREIIYIRKQLWPLREVLSQFKKTESKLLNSDTQKYLNDVYDHTIQILDTIESLRDIVSGMTDLYLSSVSNKMNEIMKVLTIFAAIFIPLTFVAGVYGMNFTYMPELGWKYGYLMVWTIFLIVGFGLFYLFKKKDWL